MRDFYIVCTTCTSHDHGSVRIVFKNRPNSKHIYSLPQMILYIFFHHQQARTKNHLPCTSTARDPGSSTIPSMSVESRVGLPREAQLEFSWTWRGIPLVSWSMKCRRDLWLSGISTVFSIRQSALIGASPWPCTRLWMPRKWTTSREDERVGPRVANCVHRAWHLTVIGVYI